MRAAHYRVAPTETSPAPVPETLARLQRWFLRAGVFLLPLAYWWGTYDRYILPKLVLARVFVIVLLILFLARAIVSRSLTINRPPLDLPLLAFVASALLSTVFAYNQNVAVFGTYSRYDGLLTILLYAGLFWLSVQHMAGPADARTLLRVLLASGYLVAALAILQSVTGSVQQEALVPAYGTLGQQNVLGAFLAMLCPLAYWELIEAKSWSKRVIAINLLIVIGVALILTLSRSAWLGIVIAALVLILGGRHSVRPRVVVVATLIAIGLVVGGLTVGRGLQIERQIQARAAPVL